MKLFSIFIIPFILLTFNSNAQNRKEESKSIVWYSFEDAIKLCEKKPKKIFVDIFTNWCGWCKQMDVSTFADSNVATYMMKHYYAVKLNAEQSDTIVFNGNTYVNPSPGTHRSSHQLAIALLKGQMLYPSFVIMNKKFENITVIKGYKSSGDMLLLLKFYGEDIYEKMSWQQYLESNK